MAIKFYFTALCWHVNFCHHCHHKTAWCYGGDMVVLWKGLFLHVRVWAKKPQTVQMYCLRFVSCSHLFTPVHTCSHLFTPVHACCVVVSIFWHILTHFDTYPQRGCVLFRYIPICSDIIAKGVRFFVVFCSILQYIVLIIAFGGWLVCLHVLACFGIFWHIFPIFPHIST